MSVQIKTTEGILTLSNASDVRTTGAMVVRGHKGVVLGFIAPAPAGGWVTSQSLEALEGYAARAQKDPSPGLTLEAAAASLAR